MSDVTQHSDEEWLHASRAARKRTLWLVFAALTLLAVGVVGVRRWRVSGRPDDALHALSLVEPESGASVSRGPTRFTWRRIPSALSYTLELQASDGTALHSLATVDTSVTASLAAMPTGAHRWLVRASTDFGIVVRSETRLLRVH